MANYVVKLDMYQTITNQIVELIEKGAGNYQRPWLQSFSTPINALTGEKYKGGLNRLNLWACAESKGYANHYWATYKQWQELGAQVRQGEKSSFIIVYNQYQKEIENEDGQTETELRRMFKAGYVFNAEQVDGWTNPNPEPVLTDLTQRVEQAETLIATTGADIRTGGGTACYVPSTDQIHMPDRTLFLDTLTATATEHYYAVLLHELTHWSGHNTRCNRDLKGKFGSNSYAMEELVADLGAAFLCADLGISLSPRADHAQYIANWLQVLKNDKFAIFTAAGKASEAAEYLATCNINKTHPALVTALQNRLNTR